MSSSSKEDDEDDIAEIEADSLVVGSRKSPRMVR